MPGCTNFRMVPSFKHHAMNPEQVRKQTIIALFSDDYLFERLVLKGGNAIHIAHKLSSRASLDLDFSITGDFEDLDEARNHLYATLKRHFAGIGFVVFDEQLLAKPKVHGVDDRPWWGGYELSFKLIRREDYNAEQLPRMQREALPIGPRQERKFSVDLSKYEYTASKIQLPLDEYTIPVYSLEMIAAEKLRALCQQMPKYRLKGVGTPRARDFYDIHLVLTARQVDLATAENHALIKNVFSAKKVPLNFLGKLAGYREFHRGDWPAVTNAVGETLKGYDFYFDFVVALTEQLKPLWQEDAPI